MAGLKTGVDHLTVDASVHLPWPCGGIILETCRLFPVFHSPIIRDQQGPPDTIELRIDIDIIVELVSFSTAKPHLFLSAPRTSVRHACQKSANIRNLRHSACKTRQLATLARLSTYIRPSNHSIGCRLITRLLSLSLNARSTRSESLATIKWVPNLRGRPRHEEPA